MAAPILFGFGLIVIIGSVALLIGVIVAIVRGNWGIAAALGAVGVVALLVVVAGLFSARVSQREVVVRHEHGYVVNAIEARERVERIKREAAARGYRFFQGPPDVPTPDVTALAAVPPSSPAHDRIKVTGIVSAVYDANTNSQVEQEARLELLESDAADIAIRNDAAERLAAYFETLVSQEQPATSRLKGLRDDLARIGPREREILARRAILEFSTPAGSEIISTATVNDQPVFCRVQRWWVSTGMFEQVVESVAAATTRKVALPQFGTRTRIVLIIALIIVVALLLRAASRHHTSRQTKTGDMS